MKSKKSVLAVLLSLALSASTVVCGTVTAAAASEYNATGDNTHAIEADGKTACYDAITVNKTGSGEGEDADFYGENAAIFATNGATLTVSNANITTNGKYANAVFSYGEGTTINISDSTITTSERNSGGIMVTGGGTLNASNLTIETEGGSSAAIRSDRGGGILNVDGGSYTANGSGSPAIYSTADITVSNATLQSGSAQAVVVEGGNTVTLTNCDVIANNIVQNSDKSSYYQAVMLYQSMSGDAAGGNGSFTMNGGSLTSLNGGMFFVTNATYTIQLSDVDLTYADEELLRICAAGWGNTGSNGGQVTFEADNQELEGNIFVDEVSALNMYLANGSNYTGAFENDGDVYLEISEDSSWTLTADCSISSLSCAAGSIHLNGYTLTVNGKEYVEGTESTGSAVVFTESTGNGNGQQPQGTVPEKPEENSGMNKPEDGKMASQQPQETVPEKPEENSGMNKPEDGNMTSQQPQGTVPEKPEENSGMNKPEDGNMTSQQPQGIVPEKPEENSGMNKPENGNAASQKIQGTVPAMPNENKQMDKPNGNNSPAIFVTKR